MHLMSVFPMAESFVFVFIDFSNCFFVRSIADSINGYYMSSGAAFDTVGDQHVDEKCVVKGYW